MTSQFSRCTDDALSQILLLLTSENQKCHLPKWTHTRWKRHTKTKETVEKLNKCIRKLPMGVLEDNDSNKRKENEEKPMSEKKREHEKCQVDSLDTPLDTPLSDLQSSTCWRRKIWKIPPHKIQALNTQEFCWDKKTGACFGPNLHPWVVRKKFASIFFAPRTKIITLELEFGMALLVALRLVPIFRLWQHAFSCILGEKKTCL